eukprot:g14651.t1
MIDLLHGVHDVLPGNENWAATIVLSTLALRIMERPGGKWVSAGPFIRMAVGAIQLRARSNATKVGKQLTAAGDLQKKAHTKANKGDSDGASRLISEAQRLTFEVRLARFQYGVFAFSWVGTYLSAIAALRRMAYDPITYSDYSLNSATFNLFCSSSASPAAAPSSSSLFASTGGAGLGIESLALPDGIVLPSIVAALALSINAAEKVFFTSLMWTLRCVYYPILVKKADEGPIFAFGQPMDLAPFVALVRPLGLSLAGVWVYFVAPCFSAGHLLFYLTILSYQGVHRVFERSGFARNYLLGEAEGGTMGADIRVVGREGDGVRVADQGPAMALHGGAAGSSPLGAGLRLRAAQRSAAFFPLSSNYSKRGRYLPGHGNSGADSQPATSLLSIPLALRNDPRAARIALEEQCAKMGLPIEQIEREKVLFRKSSIFEQLKARLDKKQKALERHARTRFAFDKGFYQGTCPKTALFHLRQRILGHTSAALDMRSQERAGVGGRQKHSEGAPRSSLDFVKMISARPRQGPRKPEFRAEPSGLAP